MVEEIMDFLSIIGNISTIKDTAQNVLAPFMIKRENLLREIIQSEIRQGDFSRVYEDDKIAICYRLMRDAMEGVAKNNLRLMAHLVCGLNEKEQLTAPNFQKYAKIIADLDQDEVKILAISARNIKNHNYDFSCYDKALDDALVEIYGAGEGFNKFSQEEKPYNICKALLTGLQRTGLIQMNSMSHASYSYGRAFSLTSRFKVFYDLFPNWEDIASWDWEDNQ